MARMEELNNNPTLYYKWKGRNNFYKIKAPHDGLFTRKDRTWHFFYFLSFSRINFAQLSEFKTTVRGFDHLVAVSD